MLKDKIIEWFNICKIHWKEIFALSFALHFVIDIFVFWLGFIIGRMT